MSRIQSESLFLLQLIIYILRLPYLLVLVVLGKRDFKEITGPARKVLVFLIQPRVTVFLMMANLFVFMLQFFMTRELFLSLVFHPVDLFELNTVPIVMSWFMHASVSHLLGNMLFLYIFGRIVEMNFGSYKTIIIYFGSAIIATVLAAFAGEAGIGASGAIAGLISTSILVAPFYLTYLVAGIPIPIFLVGWGAILADVSGIMYRLEDNVAHFAHLGGYLAVSVIVFALERNERTKMKRGMLINLMILLSFLILQKYF